MIQNSLSTTPIIPNVPGNQPLPPVASDILVDPFTQKVDQVAIESFKVRSYWNQFCSFIERIVVWIKSIPSIVTNIFIRCFASDKDISNNDSSQIDISNTISVKIEPPKREPDKFTDEAIKNLKQNPTDEGINYLLEFWERDIQFIEAEIGIMKFKNLKDLGILNDINSIIEKRLKKVEELTSFFDTVNIPEEIKKTSQEKLEQLKTKISTIQENLKTKCIAKKDKIEQLQKDGTKAPANKWTIPQLLLDQGMVQTSGPANTPPSFENLNNNCWFHAALELLWVLGEDFHHMVNDKYGQLDALVQKYNDDMEAFTENKQRYQLDKELYKNLPDERKLVEPKPKKPIMPDNPKLLIERLKEYSDAIRSGNSNKIRHHADLVQMAVRYYNADLINSTDQQDPSAFIQLILDFLSKSLFTLERVTRGENLYLQKSLDQHVLKLSYNKLVNQDQLYADNDDFQNILDHNFEIEKNNDPDNAIRGVVNYTITQQLIAPENLPDFLFVQMIQFNFPNREEKDKLKLKVEKQRQELITSFADEAMKDRPEEFKDLEAAKEYMTREMRHLLPVYIEPPDKITTKIQFPENHQISFAKAFGEENPEKFSDYIYELHGCIIQKGDMGGGHYIANVQSMDSKNAQSQWYRTDDTGKENSDNNNDKKRKVRTLSIDKALLKNQKGYIYFFRKVKPKQ